MKIFLMVLLLTSLLCLSCLKTVEEKVPCPEGTNCNEHSAMNVPNEEICSDGVNCDEHVDMSVANEPMDECEVLVDDDFESLNGFWNNLIQGAYLDSGQLVLPVTEGSMEWPHALSRSNLNLRSILVETLLEQLPPLESGVMFIFKAGVNDVFEVDLIISYDEVCFSTTQYARTCSQLNTIDSPLWLRMQITVDEIIGEYSTTGQDWNELGRTSDFGCDHVFL